MPPQDLIKKVLHKAAKHSLIWKLRLRDRICSSYPSQVNLSINQLATLFTVPSISDLEIFSSRLSFLTNHYLAHRFNLLGSGWVEVKLGTECRGVEGNQYSSNPSSQQINLRNRYVSSKIRALIISGYHPIDWTLDFKSGFQWPVKTWYADIRYGKNPGVDVKVPWELARFQHLPHLAWAYALAKAGYSGFFSASVYRDEFRNQILDFIGSNPPRFGVNWACAMDVAIRIANILLAYDFFCGYGATFDEEFVIELNRTVVAHGDHIINNLEWFPELRSNHYYANLAGLLFVSAYLPASSRSNAWLNLSLTQLDLETALQFHEDGTNFEGSIAYHHLTAEMAIYSAAIATRIDSSRLNYQGNYSRNTLGWRGPGQLPPSWRPVSGGFPGRHLARFSGMASFSKAVTMPNGSAVQFGDNDSGRFLKLLPIYKAEKDTWHKREIANDHRHLAVAFAGFLGRPPPNSAPLLEFELLNRAKRSFSVDVIEESPQANYVAFEKFGVYIYHHHSYYMAVRCGDVGQNGNGGHAHNDQLSFELALNKVTFFVDSGTYLYTPLPNRRNEFRRTDAHNTLIVDGREQNRWEPGPAGLFSMNDVSNVKVIEASKYRFEGECDLFGVPHRRILEFSGNALHGQDECHFGPRTLLFHLAPGVRVNTYNDRIVSLTHEGVTAQLEVSSGNINVESGEYSNEYGQLSETTVLRWLDVSRLVKWRVYTK